MTKEDWDKVEAHMNSQYGHISLLCDGFRLTLVSGIYKRKLSSMVYVNGHFKGKWFSEDCEERRRFFRPAKVPTWKPSMIKGMSKRTMKSLGIDPKETSIRYDATWGSFRALKAHLIKNNTSIELAPEA